MTLCPAAISAGTSPASAARRAAFFCIVRAVLLALELQPAHLGGALDRRVDHVERELRVRAIELERLLGRQRLRVLGELRRVGHREQSAAFAAAFGAAFAARFAFLRPACVAVAAAAWTSDFGAPWSTLLAPVVGWG